MNSLDCVEASKFSLPTMFVCACERDKIYPELICGKKYLKPTESPGIAVDSASAPLRRVVRLSSIDSEWRIQIYLDSCFDLHAPHSLMLLFPSLLLLPSFCIVQVLKINLSTRTVGGNVEHKAV